MFSFINKYFWFCSKVKTCSIVDPIYWKGVWCLIYEKIIKKYNFFFPRRTQWQRIKCKTNSIVSKPAFPSRVNVAWVIDGHLDIPVKRFEQLSDSVKMRVSNLAEWINNNSTVYQNYLYDTNKRYDVVVFFKAMGVAYQQEAAKIQSNGGKVIFDANVNYYEIWGDFESFSNKTSNQQQLDSITMTSIADACVGDSRIICEKAKKYNPHTYLITDNVDLDTFRFVREHESVSKVRIVWSGISFKADHLMVLKDVFSKLKNVELIIVAEKVPKVMRELNTVLPCRFVLYSDTGYAKILSECDIIISPKQLVNSYEIGHTEYKIALGMAAGLPVVASPQQSYIDAVFYKGGGIIASSSDEWYEALRSLAADCKLRADIGKKARDTIIEKYSLPTVAQKYIDVFQQCLNN